MNYDLYIFVSKLFQPETGDSRTRDKAISSHGRLRQIVREKFQSDGLFFGDDLVAAADRKIAEYKKEDAIQGSYYVETLSDEMLDELESKSLEQFFEYRHPILAGYRLMCRDMGAAADPYVIDELISLISWRTMSSGPASIQSIIQPKLEIFEKDASARLEEVSDTLIEHKKLV